MFPPETAPGGDQDRSPSVGIENAPKAENPRQRSRREPTVALLVQSLLEHRGPTPGGGIHPENKVVALEYVEEVLRHAATIDPIIQCFKPYHSRGVLGLFKDVETVEFELRRGLRMSPVLLVACNVS